MYFPNGYYDSIEAVNGYDGGDVDRTLAEKALDFFIASEQDDNVWYRASEEELAKARMILRTFAERQEPKTFYNLQRLFYTFSNSLKYRWSPDTISIVRIELSKAWEGLYGWRD